ncbi:uncharacterized protein dcma isoform X3 [Drosophila virilis]|uniref:uncharacterized protein dcma isoform X3 n=1 Tax=Drosophila virilis TaxID=7244 RepID=UPI0038B3B0D3
MLTTHHLHHLHHHRGSTAVELDKVTNLNTLIVEINSHVALFRDMLIHVGQAKDCPELREKIRKLRRTCVEAFKHTAQILMPQVKSAMAEGILTDNPHLVLLFYMAQLFLRELVKSYRLIQVVPMDMSGYYGKLEEKRRLKQTTTPVTPVWTKLLPTINRTMIL